MGMCDICIPVIPGLLKHGYPLKAYPAGVIGVLRLLSLIIYFLTLVTFAGTFFIYNPINLFGDTLLESPSISEIRQTFGPGCAALSVPTADQLGDTLPLTALVTRAARFDPGAPKSVFANGDPLDGAIVEDGDVVFTEFVSNNQTNVIRFNLIVKLNTGKLIRCKELHA